jgi:hypothetical protein
MAVKRKKVSDESGAVELVETYSTINHKLQQKETKQTYGSAVVDAIAGYDEDDIPYSRYTYTETDEPDEPIPEPDEVIEE